MARLSEIDHKLNLEAFYVLKFAINCFVRPQYKFKDWLKEAIIFLQMADFLGSEHVQNIAVIPELSEQQGLCHLSRANRVRHQVNKRRSGCHKCCSKLSC